MAKDFNAEEQLLRMRDALESARNAAHKLVVAVHSGLADEAELQKLASETLTSVETCLTLETVSDLARRELTRRVLAGETFDDKAKLLN